MDGKDVSSSSSHDATDALIDQRPRQYLLMTLPGPERPELTGLIKKLYPWIDVGFFRVDDTDNFVDVMELGDRVPREQWLQTTMLVTLFALPRSVDMVPNLKYIHIFSAGIDHYAHHPFFSGAHHDIQITTSAGIAAPPIAEHTVMTLLSLTKRLPLQLSWQRQHQWGPKLPFLSSIGDWVGKTVGIAGYGSIGRHIARILVAMGASVHAYTLSPRPTAESRRDRNYRVPGTGDPEGRWPTKWFSGSSKADLHTFLGSGLHALVLSLPLTPTTRHLMGTEEFELLYRTSPFAPSNQHFDPFPPSSSSGAAVAATASGAFIINIARGAIIDQPALIDALRRRIIHGAALDVTDPEPLPASSELWDLDNCIVTPHTSGVGREYLGRGVDVLMANLARMFAPTTATSGGDGGETGERGSSQLFNLVEPGKGY